MDIKELKRDLKVKSCELEAAIEAGRPHKELLSLYKELKELQYEILQAELAEEMTSVK
ncbi:MAG: hypothetical protein ACJ748_14955 [Flavisolibacter sp.]